jgi:hypothetical protein
MESEAGSEGLTLSWPESQCTCENAPGSNGREWQDAWFQRACEGSYGSGTLSEQDKIITDSIILGCGLKSQHPGIITPKRSIKHSCFANEARSGLNLALSKQKNVPVWLCGSL